MVMVNSPHNPTGAVLSDDEMARVHDLCAEKGVRFVSDEVFHPIYHARPSQSAARLPHATVLGDLSKAVSLSGLRVGWIVDRDRARRERYANAKNTSRFRTLRSVSGWRGLRYNIARRSTGAHNARRVPIFCDSISSSPSSAIKSRGCHRRAA